MNKKDVLSLIERLNTEEYFANFKIKKGDCCLVRKFDWGWQKVSFDYYNGFDPDRKELAFQIRVSYSVRINFLHKWFEPFYMGNNLSDLKNRESIGFSEGFLRTPKDCDYWFLFLESCRETEEDYQTFENDVTLHAKYVFDNYCAISSIYTYEVMDRLNGKREFPTHNGEWLFNCLLLTHIADSENYPTVKKVILGVMEYNYQHYKVNHMVEMYENYYQKKDEIIQTLKSLPIDLPKDLIG